MRCRLNAPLMVLAYWDNHQAAVTVPAGEIIDVLGPAENDDRFAVVRFRGERFHALETDVEQQAMQLTPEEETAGALAKAAAH